MSSHKTFSVKRFFARKQKQNGAAPQWIHIKTRNKIKYNSKRKGWRSELSLQRTASMMTYLFFI
ncbi:large ribosomal subunit protein eL39-like [Notamacropus eugenii]|uniref:large ribosomal subunit protein eL39-like n=1 Tax=Notamacropus eugenii TaxID=9315 RepID=UPI003B676F90